MRALRFYGERNELGGAQFVCISAKSAKGAKLNAGAFTQPRARVRIGRAAPRPPPRVARLFAENSMRRYEHMLQRKKGTPGCPVLKAGFISLAGLWTLARIK